MHSESLCYQALQSDGAGSLQYDVTEGYPLLKEFLCEWLGRQGLLCKTRPDASHERFSAGAGSGGQDLPESQRPYLVENPTYLGAIQAFNAYEPTYIPISMDASGLLIEEAEAKIRKRRPTFAYLVPTSRILQVHHVVDEAKGVSEAGPDASFAGRRR